jgi:L-2-hydroxyglutarate oxidase
MAVTKGYDIVIVGGGIIGLTIARELVHRGIKNIAILEKEPSLGMHASGRNSGVLHAGIYYAADSMKARFCARGARMMKEYAAARSIPVLNTGKIIVAQTAAETSQIQFLYERSLANGIRVEKISASRVAELEPAARTVEVALYSPDTSVIDSKGVLEGLRQDLLAAGVTLGLSDEALEINPQQRLIKTRFSPLSFGHLVNAAGMHADRLAHQMGVGLKYRLLPFRGSYQKLRNEAARAVRGLIYPVPDLSLPFLGVHLTRTIKGDVLAGPTAMPAFGREHYNAWEGIGWKELPQLGFDFASMLIGNCNHLGEHVASEIRKRIPGGMYNALRSLMPSLRPDDLISNAKEGLRAQLFNTQTRKLEMDFVIESGPHSTHILNAVSPGFTASMAFAEMVADRVLGLSSSQAVVHG